MDKILLSIIMLVGLMISGCGGMGSSIHSQVGVFHNITEQHKGKKIVVLPFQKELENSLEFQNYRKIIETKLRTNGFEIVEDKGNSNYIAFVSYGINGGKEQVVSSPVFGSTGGGTTYSSGTVTSSGGGYGSYSGSSYTMPTFGVIGSSTSSITNYTRQLAIDLIETSTLEKDKVKKIYEGRVKSIGTCGMVAAVMPSMIESLFKTFPQKSGSTNTIVLPWNGTC